MRRAFNRCGACGASQEVDVERGRVEDPAGCDAGGCGVKGAMELVHNRSLFIDKQQVKLQEAPENVPEGETPSQIVLYVFEEMVDAVVPVSEIGSPATV
jgi:DNA replication licensing factor MCM4